MCDAAISANVPLADIVVGVDGSDESFAALRWAVKEASLTGQHVNAVYGWTPSWDMGAEPDTDDAWTKMRHDIAQMLREWVGQATEGLTIDDDSITLTSVRASGTSALLQIGRNAQQIVVGRRSLGRVARWFTGSLSQSLAQAASVPVTVVRILDSEESSVQDAIANALTPGDDEVRFDRPTVSTPKSQRPIVIGVDGSPTSHNALNFAVDLAMRHHAPLHVMFCWQMKDLGTVDGYENAIAPVQVGQAQAEKMLNDLVKSAALPGDLDVTANAFHIHAAKGLIAASRYARHLVVGSRGLTGSDAHFLGSVSKQIVNFAECTVTVVH